MCIPVSQSGKGEAHVDNREKVKGSLNITDEMLNQLTEGLSTQEDLFGRDGLMRRLQKAIIEKMLSREMDFHLDPVNNPESGHNQYTVQKLYGVEVSHTLVSEITETVVAEVRE